MDKEYLIHNIDYKDNPEDQHQTLDITLSNLDLSGHDITADVGIDTFVNGTPAGSSKYEDVILTRAGGGTTDPYAGYDLVFSTDYDISFGDWTVIKGDFAAVKAKLIAGEPVHGIAYYLSDYTQTTIECPVYLLRYDDANDNIYILLHNFNGDTDPAIVWLNDGRVIWDE